MKKILILALILILAAFIVWALKININFDTSNNTPHITVNGRVINIKIADEASERQRGLSNQKSLAKNKGLLFIFPDKQIRSFWMKNMHFPIDIIWLDDNIVVGVSKNLLPEGEQPQNTYGSILPVNYVLEVNSGVVDGLNIKIGDEITLSL